MAHLFKAHPFFVDVIVHQAKNLISPDPGGSSDPYVKVTVGRDTKKTRHVKKSLNPSWDETFKFKVVDPTNEKIIVRVLDKSNLFKSSSLGELEIPLCNLPKDTYVKEWFRLGKVSGGDILISLRAVAFGASTKELWNQQAGQLTSNGAATVQPSSIPPSTSVNAPQSNPQVAAPVGYPAVGKSSSGANLQQYQQPPQYQQVQHMQQPPQYQQYQQVQPGAPPIPQRPAQQHYNPPPTYESLNTTQPQQQAQPPPQQQQQQQQSPPLQQQQQQQGHDDGESMIPNRPAPLPPNAQQPVLMQPGISQQNYGFQNNPQQQVYYQQNQQAQHVPPQQVPPQQSYYGMPQHFQQPQLQQPQLQQPQLQQPQSPFPYQQPPFQQPAFQQNAPFQPVYGQPQYVAPAALGYGYSAPVPAVQQQPQRIYQQPTTSAPTMNTPPDTQVSRETKSKLQQAAQQQGWGINFNEIRFEKKIGVGGFGEVWKGEWAGTKVAIKKILAHNISESDMEEFSKEIMLMSKLRHPNIVAFLGATLEPEFCLLTEFMERGSLFHCLADKSNQIPWDKKVSITLDIAKGMTYLHTRTPAIVHRDIKSLNILISKDWKAVVSDFGLTKIKEQAAMSTRCGSPAWSAPEVLRGEPYNELADVFSFGIVMWEILTDRPPYEGMTPMQLIGQVAYQKPSLRPPVPQTCPDPRYVDLMTKCWDDDPGRRPSFQNVIEWLRAMQP